jgi:cytochrome c oxidase subunit 2
VYVVTMACLVLSMVRARQREKSGEVLGEGGQQRLTRAVSYGVGATVVILLIFLGYDLSVGRTLSPVPDKRPLTIELTGHQWWWEYKYPEYGVTTANELVLPVGRTVDLKMHSADVVHSFWIPRVGGKRDVNPQPRVGRGERAPASNHLTFNIDEPGFYTGQCAEFCGLSHAIMRGAVVAVPANEFAQWVTSMGGRAGTAPTTPAAWPRPWRIARPPESRACAASERGPHRCPAGSARARSARRPTT